MPIINGKKVRARYTSLKLGEISSVDNPAQPGALGSVIKRMEDPAEAIANIAKYVCADDGAHSFTEVLQENKFSEEIWPYTDALSQSIRSIVGDRTIGGADREAKITASVEEFLTAVRGISPVVSKQLEGLINKREVEMPKTVEELQGELTKANERADRAEKALADAQAAQKMAEDAKDAAEEEADKAKKALTEATDEVIKVEGVDVRKSEVGEGQFKLTKALVEKSDRVEIEKRAGDRFPHLVGTATAKAALLKAAESITDEEVQKSALNILDAAEKMTKSAFDRFGTGDPDAEPTRKAAVATFAEKVQEIKKRDNCAEFEAMQKARTEFPAEFEASQQAAA